MSTGIRIAKKIAISGAASRRAAEELIAAGKVKVDGVVVTSPVCFVTDDHVITIEDKPIAPVASEVMIWKFHKPKGVLTTRSDPKNRPTVFECIPHVGQRMIYIGRLDYNTEGLLLFTNNGEISRKIELPSSGVKRTYRARIFGSLTPEKIQRLKKGVVIDGVKYGSIDVQFDTGEASQSANKWVTVTLSEGKNREIRKVMEYFHCTVNRLIRVDYGGISLGKLPRGAFEKASKKEVATLLRKLK